MQCFKFLFAKMIYRLIFVLSLNILVLNSLAQKNSFTVCSWNLKDLGRTKSNEKIEFIAKLIKDYDIILIQEVVARDPAGAQAVGRLGEALKRLGSNWEYRISDITSGENSYKNERYAFLWQPSKVKLLGKPWLEKRFHSEIDREPFMATFLVGKDSVTLVNFHAITKSKQPEREIKYFKFLPEEYPDLNLIFGGDFNLPQSHTVFNPLKKMGYASVFVGQKTTIKKRCIMDDCLSQEFDNFYFPAARIKLRTSKVIHFYKEMASLDEANLISDHLPIMAEFEIY